MPIYARCGLRVGDCAKGLGEHSGSKVYNYMFRDFPRLHYPVGGALSDACVLVEDVISSVKVSQVLSSCALLGTELGEREALDLRKKYSKLIVMLDNDACGKAVQIAARWRCLFQTKVIPMKKDPKDTSYDELRRLLGE